MNGLRLFAATASVFAMFTASAYATTVTYNFTGGAQSFVVPDGVESVGVRAWGAQGRSNALGVGGGLGGLASGDLAVMVGDTLNIYVGGGGGISTTGGFNGGGNADATTTFSQARAGGGGGATDIRVGGTGLADRVIVAGGGGGAGGNRVISRGRGGGGGGGAGYYGGGGGAAWPSSSPILPTGGSQVAGGDGGTSFFFGAPNNNGTAGSLGQGGNGGAEVASGQGGSATARPGGVGGGLVGGSGQYSSNFTGQSGAGGSSFIDHADLSNGTTLAGARSGNGALELTYNLPSLMATETNVVIDFGTVAAGDMVDLMDAIVLENIGGAGSFIDLSGAAFGSMAGFSIVGGDAMTRLNDANLAEMFDLRFDATGLGGGVYSSSLQFTTTEGIVTYNLTGTVQAAVSEPAGLALVLAGLVPVIGFVRRKR